MYLENDNLKRKIEASEHFLHTCLFLLYIGYSWLLLYAVHFSSSNYNYLVEESLMFFSET